MPGTILLSPLMFTVILQGRHHDHPQLMDEETEHPLHLSELLCLETPCQFRCI